MDSYERRRQKILDAATTPLQRRILAHMPNLVFHPGNANHAGNHVVDHELSGSIGATLDECDILYTLVRMSSEHFVTFWEIGSYVGWTTAFIAEGLRKRRPTPGLLYAVDDFLAYDVPDVVERRFIVNTTAWSPQIRLNRGTSPGTLKTLPPPDWVFVDGFHHKGQPLRDVQGAYNAAQRAGLSPDMVLHDAWIPDVSEAVFWLRELGYETIEFPTPNKLTLATQNPRSTAAVNYIMENFYPAGGR